MLLNVTGISISRIRWTKHNVEEIYKLETCSRDADIHVHEDSIAVNRGQNGELRQV